MAYRTCETDRKQLQLWLNEIKTSDYESVLHVVDLYEREEDFTEINEGGNNVFDNNFLDVSKDENSESGVQNDDFC